MWRRTGRQVVKPLVCEHARHAVEQGHVDVLADTGGVACSQRRLNGYNAVEAGKNIGERHAGFLRWAIRLAGDVHQAAHTLNDEVIPRPGSVRATLTEAGNRAIDNSGIDGGDACEIEAVLGEPADLEVFYNNIGIGRQRSHTVSPFLRRKVDNAGSLAAIRGMKIRGITAAVAALDKRRAPGACVVATRAFHLQYIGAEIGEYLSGPRPGEDTCKLKDANASQRCITHRLSPTAYPRFGRRALGGLGARCDGRIERRIENIHRLVENGIRYC